MTAHPRRRPTTPRLHLTRTLPASIAAMTLACLGGCAATGAGGGYATTTSADSGPAGARSVGGINHDAFATLGYRLSWRGQPVLGRSGDIRFFEAIDDGVLVHSTNQIVTFMDRATGANRWSATLGRPIDRFVGLTDADDSVMVASDNELFVLDRRTGEISDRQRLAVVVSTPPAVVGPIAVFGSVSGEALGHNLETGFKLWGYGLRGAIESPPVVIDRSVGVVNRSGEVLIIDTQSGLATLRARIFGGLANRPVAADDAMFVASLDQSVYAFALRGTSWLWRVRTESPISAQPALIDGMLVVEIPGRGLVALDTGTGEELWASPEASGDPIGVRDGLMISFDRARATAFIVDPRNGDLVARETMPGVERMVMRPEVDGDLFTTHAHGFVDKFVPRS